MLSFSKFEEEENTQYSVPPQLEYALDEARVFEKCCLVLREPLDACGDRRIGTTYGGTITPFGSARLRVFDFLLEAVRVGSEHTKISLVAHGFFKTAMRLCIHYEWNSFVHSRAETLFSGIFRSSSPHSCVFRAGVLANSGLCEVIAEAAAESTFRFESTQREIRKGYMGHLVRLSNVLV